MAQLPTAVSATKTLLDSILIKRRRGKTIGMGTIGDPCDRRLWFALHWAVDEEPISLRLSNLFQTGTNAEEFIIKDLERIGIRVTQRQEELWGFMDHEHGFTDGRCENVPEAPKTVHLLEMKTHNEKNFKKLVEKGVKTGFPRHYAQVQRYMKENGLKRCLYVGYNKNTSAYYIERIRFDPGFAEDLARKGRDVILADEAPMKKFEPSWFECKFCDFSEQCHQGAPLAVNCRTCDYSDLAPEGKWLCTYDGNSAEIPLAIQETGCSYYKAIKII
jgi:hypothetical protein